MYWSELAGSGRCCVAVKMDFLLRSCLINQMGMVAGAMKNKDRHGQAGVVSQRETARGTVMVPCKVARPPDVRMELMGGWAMHAATRKLSRWLCDQLRHSAATLGDRSATLYASSFLVPAETGRLAPTDIVLVRELVQRSQFDCMP
jgi:hypothetical protein